MDEVSLQRLGTVVSTDKGPNVMEFSFVTEGGANDIVTRRGEFVSVVTDSGTVIARVQDLVQTNRYYQQAEAVREYQSRGEPLRSIFPTDRWQYTIARARVLGLWSDEKRLRPYFAVSPGAVVRRTDDDVLSSFLSLDVDDGLLLGKLSNHDLEFTPNMTRLLSKHLAILAMSGAGKSYFVSVLLEEILSRPKDKGRLAVVVIDVHGEYTYLKNVDFTSLGITDDVEVEHIRGSHFQIATRSLSAEALASFVSDMSTVQQRDLRRVLTEIQQDSKEGYSLIDIMDYVREDETISKNTKDALLGWLMNLENTNLFGKEASPQTESVIRPGKLTLIDLSDFISLRKKQIVVANLVSELLFKRRQGRIPPFLIVLEEAHQFCPESRQEIALPKSRIETIAREGRKFFALLCLVSQRPVKLSTTVLSQCTNQAILRCTNPYDLEHIGRSSEGIDKSSLEAITTLEVGEALFVGEAVSVPSFVKIRKRHLNPEGETRDLLRAIQKADK
ncbi:MAG: ATP-binding protein [Candidatus Thorarchaeota archaeon]|nr:MAG: ATP-binding protein [Candidatus Thorarchaeota archaeon]